ncbi:MAG: carbohydrate binding family 9 domain-containing protein, partial [bacterium]
MRRWFRLLATSSLLGVLALVSSPVSALQVDQSRPGSDVDGGYDHELAPVARAVKTGESVTVDGLLKEGIWLQASPISGFLQTLPFEGEPVTERTEVRIVYDEDAIYIGAQLSDRNPVTTRLARRDSQLGDSDSFVFLIDSYHDHETGYRFWTNPSGVKGDATVRRNGTGRGDTSWDPVWDVVTSVSDSGWVVEMRIPFSQLRFSPEEQQVWGIQIERNIHRNQENATYPFTPNLERSGVSRFGHLHGIAGIEPGQRLELLPYVIARGEYLESKKPLGVGFDNPYRS